MRKATAVFLFAASTLLHGQAAIENQSLGDVARAYRLQKAAQKSAKTITNEDIGAAKDLTKTSSQAKLKVKPDAMQTPAAQRLLAEIRTKKAEFEQIQQHMAQVKAQMQNGANPPGRRMMTQLNREYSADQSKLQGVQSSLDQLQEEARKMGFGNAAYDPD